MVGSQVLMQITERSALFMNIQAHAWNRQRRAWSMSQGCEHCQMSPHSCRASGHIDHLLRSGLVHVLAAVLTFISAAGPPHKLKGDLSKHPMSPWHCWSSWIYQIVHLSSAVLALPQPK